MEINACHYLGGVGRGGMAGSPDIQCVYLGADWEHSNVDHWLLLTCSCFKECSLLLRL